MSIDEKPQVPEGSQKYSFEESQEEVCEEQQRRGEYVVNTDNPEPPGRGRYVAGANNTESPEGIESIKGKSKTS